MTHPRFSIAQARSRFPGLIHDAEKGKAVEITRHGKPVAVLVSMGDYQRMTSPRQGFWEAVSAMRGRIQAGAGGLEPADLRDLRDKRPGRDFKW